MRKLASFIPKTDEIRIQSAPELLELLAGKPYYITAKLDGTSATYAYDGEQERPLVCSRNRTLIEPDDSVYWRIAKKYDLCRKVQEWPKYAIQGEIVGPGIQGNKLGLSEIDFFIFNVLNLSTSKLMPFDHVEMIGKLWGVKTVPVIETGGWFEGDLESMLCKAEGKYEGTDNEREGIVVRKWHDDEYVDTHNHKGRLSFKVISNKFLLKDK